VARLPARIHTVGTARAAPEAEPASREHRAERSGQTPKTWYSPVRRIARRETRGQGVVRPGTRKGPPVIPARPAHRNHPPAGHPDSQGHRDPEDRQRPDRSGPRRRHARDPRRLKSLGMSSAPGPCHRLSVPLGPSLGSRGSKVLASFSFGLESRKSAPAASRQPAPGASRLEIAAPSPARRARLLYQKPPAGQLAGGDAA
jgi:hypothetical protein